MDELKELLHSRGAGLVGFADMGKVDPEARQGLPHAVSMTVALTPEIIAGIADGPTESYCDEYDRANAFLNELAAEAMKRINRDRPTHRDICGMCIAACPRTQEYLIRSRAVEA